LSRGFQCDDALPEQLPHSIPVLLKPLARLAGAMASASSASFTLERIIEVWSFSVLLGPIACSLCVKPSSLLQSGSCYTLLCVMLSVGVRFLEDSVRRWATVEYRQDIQVVDVRGAAVESKPSWFVNTTRSPRCKCSTADRIENTRGV